jgi:hypothetical protein
MEPKKIKQSKRDWRAGAYRRLREPKLSRSEFDKRLNEIVSIHVDAISEIMQIQIDTLKKTLPKKDVKLDLKSILARCKVTIGEANNWYHAVLIAMSDFDLSFREKQDLIYSICKHILSLSEDSELKSYVTEMVDYFKDRTAISDYFQRASFWRSLLLLLRGYRVHTLEAREYIQHPSRYGRLRTQESISDRVKEAHQHLVREFSHTKKGN